MKWIDLLPEPVLNRLGHCTTRKSDLPVLVSAKWSAMVMEGKQAQGFTKEDALVYILELMDANSRDFDLTIDEYDLLKS